MRIAQPHTRHQVHVHAHNANKIVEKKCPICNEPGHIARVCETFRNMNMPNRLQIVSEKALCKVCLNAHGSKRCLSRLRCDVTNCEARHNTLLHETTQFGGVECFTHNYASRSSEILFRIVPVTIHHGENSIDTLAFLDEGSAITLVEAELASSLGVTGVPEPLEMSWTGDITRDDPGSERITLSISARGDSKRYELANARTLHKLSLPQQEIDANTLIKNFAHFQELAIQSYLKAEPKLLIGLPHLQLVAPLDKRIGNPGEPTAVKSLLGWAVYGPCRSIDAGTSQSSMKHVAVGAHFIGASGLKQKSGVISN